MSYIYQLPSHPHLLVPRATEYVTLNPIAPTSDGPQIAVDAFKYDGFTFSGSLWVKSTSGTKAVAIVYSVNGTASAANDTNILAASYQSLNTSSGYESWTFSAIVPVIDEFFALCRVNGTTNFVDNNSTYNYRVVLPSDLVSYNPTFLVVAIAFYGVVGFILVLLGLNMLGYSCVRTENATGATAAANTRRKRNRDDPALHAAVAIEPQYPLSLRHPSFDTPVTAVVGDARFYPVDAESTAAAVFYDGGVLAPTRSQLPPPPPTLSGTARSSPSMRSAGSLTFTRPPPPPLATSFSAAAGSLSDAAELVAGAHKISFPLPYEMRSGHGMTDGLAHGTAATASVTTVFGGAGSGGVVDTGGSVNDRNADDRKSLFSLGSLV
ncbi:hypothetical protein HDU83_002663 [Entophlyctis luteolus]|nr:hypothetical protein HDU83_002663 [Entophlyctis luteolus]